jgi:hypothetical protein
MTTAQEMTGTRTMAGAGAATGARDRGAARIARGASRRPWRRPRSATNSASRPRESAPITRRYGRGSTIRARPSSMSAPGPSTPGSASGPRAVGPRRAHPVRRPLAARKPLRRARFVPQPGRASPRPPGRRPARRGRGDHLLHDRRPGGHRLVRPGLSARPRSRPGLRRLLGRMGPHARHPGREALTHRAGGPHPGPPLRPIPVDALSVIVVHEVGYRALGMLQSCWHLCCIARLRAVLAATPLRCCCREGLLPLVDAEIAAEREIGAGTGQASGAFVT